MKIKALYENHQQESCQLYAILDMALPYPIWLAREMLEKFFDLTKKIVAFFSRRDTLKT